MKTLKAQCIFCGKEVFSLYKKQLEYNIQVHEKHCPQRKKDEKNILKQNRN